jgi:hypothetical protein
VVLDARVRSQMKVNHPMPFVPLLLLALITGCSSRQLTVGSARPSPSPNVTDPRSGSGTASFIGIGPVGTEPPATVEVTRTPVDGRVLLQGPPQGSNRWRVSLAVGNLLQFDLAPGKRGWGDPRITDALPPAVLSQDGPAEHSAPGAVAVSFRATTAGHAELAVGEFQRCNSCQTDSAGFLVFVEVHT